MHIYLLAGGAGIFNSRNGSFLGSELWRAGWLAGGLVYYCCGAWWSDFDCGQQQGIKRKQEPL